MPGLIHPRSHPAMTRGTKWDTLLIKNIWHFSFFSLAKIKNIPICAKALNRVFLLIPLMPSIVKKWQTTFALKFNNDLTKFRCAVSFALLQCLFTQGLMRVFILYLCGCLCIVHLCSGHRGIIRVLCLGKHIPSPICLSPFL